MCNNQEAYEYKEINIEHTDGGEESDLSVSFNNSKIINNPQQVDISMSRGTSFLSDPVEDGEFKTIDHLTKSEKEAKLVLRKDYI